MNPRLIEKNKKYIIAAILVVAVFLLSFIVIKLYNSEINDEYISEKFKYNDKEYELKSGVETTLLIGLDKQYDDLSGSYLDNTQNDYLLLIVYDKDDNSTSFIAINRDSMCEVNQIGITGESVGSSYMQVALAYNYGTGKQDSCRNVRDAVSGILNNIIIDHYIAMTMDGVAIINDAVGGVEIDGTLLLGENALSYVRARKDLPTGSNLERMERQTKYEKILLDKMMDLYSEDPEFMNDSLLELNDYLISDLTINQMKNLLENMSTSTIGEIETISGINDTSKEFVEYTIDKEDMMKHIIDLYYQEVN